MLNYALFMISSALLSPESIVRENPVTVSVYERLQSCDRQITRVNTEKESSTVIVVLGFLICSSEVHRDMTRSRVRTDLHDRASLCTPLPL